MPVALSQVQAAGLVSGVTVASWLPESVP
jgi:hypothetical protein